MAPVVAPMPNDSREFAVIGHKKLRNRCSTTELRRRGFPFGVLNANATTLGTVALPLECPASSEQLATPTQRLATARADPTPSRHISVLE
jgi:hypothetical protein